MKTMAESEALEEYRRLLNEFYGVAKVAWFELDTALALELMDETAFLCGFRDWCDSEDIEIEA